MSTANKSQIKLVIPSEPEYLGLVRLASAGVAHQLELDLEVSDDLKLVAAEACGKILAMDADEICICWSWDDNSICIEVTAPEATAVKEVDPANPQPADLDSDWEEIGLLLIHSLMDEVENLTSPIGLRATKYLTVYDE